MGTIQQPDSNPIAKKGLTTDNLDTSFRTSLKDGPTESQIFAAGERTDIKQQHVKDKKEFRILDKDDLLKLKRKSAHVAGDEEGGKTTDSSPKTTLADDPDEVPTWKKLLSDDDVVSSSVASPFPWLTPGVGSHWGTKPPLETVSPWTASPGGATPPGIDPKDPIYVRQKELQAMQDRNMMRQMQMQEQQTRQQMTMSWIEHQKTMTNMIRATIKKLAEMEQEMRQAEHTATMKAGEGWIKALG